MLDYLIVGQGIAGTLLADRLLRRGKSIRIIDRGLMSSATRAASGIINPITGRSFVKSWKFDALIEEATAYYGEKENELSLELLRQLPLWRTLHTIADENKWGSRSLDSEYEGYMGVPEANGPFSEKLVENKVLGPVRGAYLVDMFGLVSQARKRWKDEKIILDEEFYHDKVEWLADGLHYGDIAAGNLVLCQGFEGGSSKWFSDLPLKGYRGEAIIVDNSSWPDQVLKMSQFVVPERTGKVWFGSYNRHDDLPPKATAEGKSFLQSRMQMLLKEQGAIQDHLCGIRPTTSDRRPLMGTHQNLPHLHIFNGLGTKGASLAPLLSKWMVEYLEDGKILPREVDVNRWSSAEKN